MEKELKETRRSFIKKTGVIVGGVALSLGGIEIMKLSDDVSRNMSHTKAAIALKNSLVNESGPFEEPTVDSLEMMGMMAGGAVFMAGVGVVAAELL